MPNGFGLMGDPSSTQSAVIVQKPGSPNIYLVFTVAAQAAVNGLRWSEVDMTLQGGLGDVTANKNILLYTPTTEKVCGVRHCNNTDVWVLTHYWGTDEFRTFLVNSSGINPVPVVSNVGSIHSGSNTNTIGYMKSSPDGSRVSVAKDFNSTIELFNFDNATGTVSNPVLLSSDDRFYGTEFSPDGTLLYAGTETNPSHLYQWNLCAGSDTAIISSRILVTSVNNYLGALQIAPNNKVYASIYSTGFLGVIDLPNTQGLGCNYINNAVSVAPGGATLGLPNFITSYLRQPPVLSDSTSSVNCLLVNFSYTTFLAGGTCTAPGNTVVSTAWNFGDPSSGGSNTSGLDQPSHIFSGSGTYNVTLVVNYSCYSDTVVQSVTVVSCGVNALMTGSTDICSGACTDITAIPQGGTPPYTYAWSPNIGSGAGPITVCPTSTTAYTVTITDGAGTSATATGTITVNDLPPADLSPGGTLAICNGTGITLHANAGDYNYVWYHDGVIVQSGSNPDYTATSPGVYQVQVGDLGSGCTSMSQTATIVLGGGPVATIVTAGGCGSILFNGGSVTLAVSAPNATSYLWSPGGATTSSIQVTQPGTYCVTAYDANGCPSDVPACTTVSTANVTCGQHDQKVILCHVPPGNPGNPQTLCIAPSAVPAHLANHPGDCLGPCSLYYPRLASGDLADMDYSFYVEAYPNPFKGTFSLELINSSTEPVNLTIYDMLGRVIESYTDVNEKTLIGSHLTGGIYFVVAEQGDNMTRIRIVKE